MPTSWRSSSPIRSPPDQRAVPVQLGRRHRPGRRRRALPSLNVQPVIPISISDDWNLISRTIVPIIYQERHLPRRRQPVRARRHHAEPVLLAQGSRPPAAGSGASGPVSCSRPPATTCSAPTKWGARPDRGRAASRRRPAGPTARSSTTSGRSPATTTAPTSATRSCSRSCVHDDKGVDVQRQLRVDLRLEGRAMDGADQLLPCQAGALRQAAGEPWRRRCATGPMARDGGRTAGARDSSSRSCSQYEASLRNRGGSSSVAALLTLGTFAAAQPLPSWNEGPTRRRS